jgi:hypothetical protein
MEKNISSKDTLAFPDINTQGGVVTTFLTVVHDVCSYLAPTSKQVTEGPFRSTHSFESLCMCG